MSHTYFQTEEKLYKQHEFPYVEHSMFHNNTALRGVWKIKSSDSRLSQFLEVYNSVKFMQTNTH